MKLISPYLLFLGNAPDQLAAKSAQGIVDWRPELARGQLRLPGCAADVGLPDMSLRDASAQGVKTLIIGIANAGGFLPEAWTGILVSALEAGLDVASGLHARLEDVPEIRAAAAHYNRRLIDIRTAAQNLPVGTGQPRTGHRMLTVGTDCSVGKMYATLAVEAEMKRRGIPALFCATGQTGIFIAGSGVPVDAVAADFISGAIEQLTPDNPNGHWDLVEGQGSLFHPSFAGVSLGLLHGAQAEALILCHEPTRTHMRGLPQQPLPSLSICVEANLEAARLTCPHVRCVGVAVNTSHIAQDKVQVILDQIEDELAIPAVDPFASGAGRLVDALLAP